MAAPGDLQALADAFLAACIEALDTIPSYHPTLKGAPDRAFTAAGIPVWDCCEQLAVHVPLLGEAGTTPFGLDEGKRANRGRVNHVSLIATVTRCVPTDLEPPVAELVAAATQINADGWALWNHLFNLKSSAQLLTLCDEMFFDGILAAVPSGGCAGWTVPVRVVLDGYAEP